MTLLFASLLIVTHAIAALILIKHRRNVRHHRATMRVIGSDPVLTEALHQRLKHQRPESDWLHPTNLRAKCAAWLRTHA